MIGCAGAAQCAEPIDKAVSRNMVMMASFDDVTDLNLSCADGWICTAATYQDAVTRRNIHDHNRRPDAIIADGKGLFGDSLQFLSRSQKVVFYKGEDFNHQRSTTPSNWSVTVSCWVRFDQDAVQRNDSSIPLQLTQPEKAGTTLTVECDLGATDELRLVASSGPSDLVGDLVADAAQDQRHVLVRVKHPPIDRDRWMHLAIMLERVNSDDWTPSRAALYMNGRLMGRPEVSFPLLCDLSQLSLVLGHHFIGQVDDLGVFNRVLNEGEMRRIYDRQQRLR